MRTKVVLVAKHDHLNRHGYGLRAHINKEFPCGGDAKNEGPGLMYMCFYVALNHSPTFVFALYRPHGEGTVICPYPPYGVASPLQQNRY